MIVRYMPVRVGKPIPSTDGVQETYESTAVVAFVAGRLHYNLLAHFRGDDHEAVLTPKLSFPGRRV